MRVRIRGGGLAVSVLLAAGGTAAQPMITSYANAANVLTVNPADLLGGVISAEFEHAVSPLWGLTAGLQVHAFRAIYAPEAQTTFSGVNPELGARIHFFSDAPAGLWLGLTANAGPIIDNQIWRSRLTWGLGAQVGYTTIFERVVVFAFGVGGGFVMLDEQARWTPRLVLAVGLAR